MTRIIVTGGAGFIGSNIVKSLNKKGYQDIIIVDRLGNSEKWKNLVNLKYADLIEKNDFINQIDAFQWNTIEYVYHLGACSSTTETNADYLAYNNYRYTKKLCEKTLENSARFVYASSAATYGAGELGYSDNPEIISTLKPLNMYGYSKQMFDEWLYRTGMITRVAGIKYFNVYGPGEAHKGDMRSMIHKAFGQIQSKGEVKLFKSHKSDYRDGEQVRDFLYVKDAVRQTLWFGENQDKNGIFNCGTGTPRTWKDLVSAVFKAMNKEPVIKFIDMPESLRDKYQYHTCADLSQLKKIGYDCKFTSLEEGVTDYWNKVKESFLVKI